MPSHWIEACEREPIHTPNATQSWGAVISADENEHCIRYASANLAMFIDCTAEQALGRGLDDLFGPELLSSLLAGPTVDLPEALLSAAASRAVASCHRLDGLIHVEIETVAADDASGTWPEARLVVQALRSAETLDALFVAAVRELRRVTGFDRVMVYRFDADGHGEVVAEACAADLESFLGLHYPAHDIPRQARRMYLRQRLRVITDVLASPVALLGMQGAASPDLSLCALRAVSPVHLEYMCNMGVRASLAASLTVDGALWGMLVCHHGERRHVGPGVRAVADLIAQVTSLMVGTLCETAARAVAARHRAQIAELAELLAAYEGSTGGLAEMLARNAAVLMAMCAASGLIIRLKGVIVVVGLAPPADEARHLLDRLLDAAPDGGDAFAVDEIGRLPALGVSVEVETACAGALLLKLIHMPGDCIAWLRPEQARLVRWGGDPRAGNDDVPGGRGLSPRRSFALWTEDVRGRSLPWTAGEIDAVHALRREIDSALVRCVEQELIKLRQHDPLTGLPNRRLFRELLDGAAKDQPNCFLVSVEIDRFRSLNDAVGERLGDSVLIEAAHRIETVAGLLRARVARTGSFAFGVLCEGIDAADATQLAELLRAEIAEPFDAGGRLIRATASLGIAPAAAVGQGESADALMARADTALQAAQAQGGDRVLVFRSELRTGASRRMDIEQELRALLGGDHERAGAFRLLYQPCVALACSNRDEAPREDGGRRLPLRGFEALLRWAHPRLGHVPPDEFIGIAESCGLIEAVGNWVLQEAIGQLAEWRALAIGLPHTVWRVAVNVSAHQLRHPDFAASVLAKLARLHVPPACLTIEVTEGVFADERASVMLAQLRASGIKVSVDDFGIGYSSLSYLRRVPADELKLDRSFLQRNDGGPLHEDMIGALVQLARAVGLSVLAEGVETDAHLAAVTAAGCDAAQGWLFAKALPPDEAASWITRADARPQQDVMRQMAPFSFRDIVDTVNEVVLVTDANLDSPGPGIVYANPAFTRLTGWRLSDVIGRSPRLLHGPKTNFDDLQAMMTTLREGRPAHARAINYNRSGQAYWCEIHVAPLRNQHGDVTHFVAIERNLTHEMRSLDDLGSVSESDPLTGIANRGGLDRFAAALGAADIRTICVARVDVDRFQTINERFGHVAGDAVLLGVTDVLRQHVRRVDFVCRLGGDDFVVCMPASSLADARRVAERLRKAVIGEAFATPTGSVAASFTIGVAAGQPDDSCLMDVIARAGMALLKAKADGAGIVAVDMAALPSVP